MYSRPTINKMHVGHRFLLQVDNKDFVFQNGIKKKSITTVLH